MECHTAVVAHGLDAHVAAFVEREQVGRHFMRLDLLQRQDQLGRGAGDKPVLRVVHFQLDGIGPCRLVRLGGDIAHPALDRAAVDQARPARLARLDEGDILLGQVAADHERVLLDHARDLVAHADIVADFHRPGFQHARKRRTNHGVVDILLNLGELGLGGLQVGFRLGQIGTGLIALFRHLAHGLVLQPALLDHGARLVARRAALIEGDTREHVALGYTTAALGLDGADTPGRLGTQGHGPIRRGTPVELDFAPDRRCHGGAHGHADRLRGLFGRRALCRRVIGRAAEHARGQPRGEDDHDREHDPDRADRGHSRHRCSSRGPPGARSGHGCDRARCR